MVTSVSPFFHHLVVIDKHFQDGAAYAGQHGVYVALYLGVVGAFVGFGKLQTRPAIVAAGEQHNGQNNEHQRIALFGFFERLGHGGGRSIL